MTFQLRINLGRQHAYASAGGTYRTCRDILKLYINNLSIHIPFFHSFLILLPIRLSLSILKFRVSLEKKVSSGHRLCIEFD